MEQDLIKRMKVEPFNIILDACSNTGLEKTFSVTVHLFDINFNRVMTKFLEMNMLVGRNTSVAEFEFNNIDT